jgi:hypothetical protein
MIGSINIHSSGTSSSSSGCIILGTNSNTTISTTSGSNLVYSSGTGAFSISTPKSTYHILGEDYEVKNTYTDPNLSIVIATLNVLKRPFWEELKKQNIKFDDDLENFIEKRLKIYDRDKKLESLLPE